jgi:hypothetical protein
MICLGQKYVHLDCLRRWQRMVLVAQPTHPAFYTDDKRHHLCNICLSPYTCAPPTRAELMESFTGPEIAALIEEHRIIAASPGFSDMLEADHREENRGNSLAHRRRPSSSYDYWFHGVYLITSVEPDTGEVCLPLESASLLQAVRRQLTPDPDNPMLLQIQIENATFVLVPGGSLAGIDPAALPTALEALTAPSSLVFRRKHTLTCADDHVAAVCISRALIANSERLQRAEAAVEAACQSLLERYPSLRPFTMPVQHYAGGPCSQSSIATCLVLGGATRGWRVVPKLGDALLLAYRLQRHSCLSLHHASDSVVSSHDHRLRPGLAVRLTGLIARPELNGLVGLTLKFNVKTGRWHVRIAHGDAVKVKSVNVEPVDDIHLRHAPVLVFWGEAQWTRAQLLGEIARGSWGLCVADVSEFVVPEAARWQQLQSSGRLAYAPVTDMTEDYIREATLEMEGARAHAVAAGVGASSHETDLVEFTPHE